MNPHDRGTAEASASKALLPLLCLLSTGALLSLIAITGGLAVKSGWHPIAFLFWTSLGGGLLLAVGAFTVGERPKPSAYLLRYGLLSGLLTFALPNILSFESLTHVGAGFIALCLSLPPLLTYMIALPLRMDRLSTKGGAGMLLGFVGAVLLALSRLKGMEGSWIWIAFTLSAPVIVSVGNIYRTIDWPEGASPQLLAPIMLVSAALMIGGYAVVTRVPLTPSAWNRSAMLLLVAEMVVLAALYTFFFLLQKLSGPVGLSQIGWIGAAIGKILAVMFLGETVPTILPVAFLLILVGIVLVSKRTQ